MYQLCHNKNTTIAYKSTVILINIINFFPITDTLVSTRTVVTSPAFLIFTFGRNLSRVAIVSAYQNAYRYIEVYFQIPIYKVTYLIGGFYSSIL